VLTLADVQRLAAALPESVEGERHGGLTWSVGGKGFAWERSFSKADIKRFGAESIPPDPIVAVRVGDLAEKDAVLAAHHDAFFTIPHFNGYAAVLVRLDRAGEDELREALEDGWLAVAPQQLAADYVQRRPG
jgi:hypothetical protein